MNDNSSAVSAATLMGVELFSELSSVERNHVAKYCRGRVFEQNEQIVSHEDKTRDVFFIISGTVRVTIYSRTGKEITFRDVSSGQMFGELSAIDSGPRSAHVIAVTECSVVSCTQEDFWQLVYRHPGVTKKTLIYLASIVRLLSDRVVEFSTLGVKNRIHAELLRLGRHALKSSDVATITPAPTHLEIANRVSTHREAVTREMGVLARQSIIKKSGNALVIKNLEKLQNMVDDVINETD